MLIEHLPDPASYPSIGWLLLALAGLAVAGNQILKLVQSVRGGDGWPEEESAALSQKALEHRVALTEGAISGIRAELKADRDHAEQLAHSRSAGIYSQINQVREELTAKMDAERTEVLDKIESVNHSLTHYAQDTERTLGRIEGKLDEDRR